MRRLVLCAQLFVAASPAFCGDSIYVLWGSSLTRFDSETPGVIEQVIPLDPWISGNLEFDPSTRQLWCFEYPICQVTCPPPRSPVRIDPQTGVWQFVDLPGLNLGELRYMDVDIDPLTRELRSFDRFGANFSYSLDRLELRIDDPLSAPFAVVALAHKPPTAGSPGVETYAIGHLEGGSTRTEGEPWLQLARIGGPHGDPPASSGEVHVLGPVDAHGERMAFDIASDGTAYLATFYGSAPAGEQNLLYRVDLGNGAVERIGAILPPEAGADLFGMSVAPRDTGTGILEVPALSKAALAALSLALAGVALPLLRRRGRTA